MLADKTTLTDLSIFESDEELSIFHHLNHTHTNQGKEFLRYILNHPLPTVDAITDIQQLIKHLQLISSQLPTTITNGTLMVIEKFYDTPIDSYPKSNSFVESFIYTILNKDDYSISKYSLEHIIVFIKGMAQLSSLLQSTNSTTLNNWYNTIQIILSHNLVKSLLQVTTEKNLQPTEVLYFAPFLRKHFKNYIFELIDIYSQLDAYLSLAKVSTKHNYTFPIIQNSTTPYLQAIALYHPLLQTPIGYDIGLTKENNFLFLTGANMAGKSTFIKAVGVSVYLAHIGMAVPAQHMKLSLFDGILSNIHVSDNIIKGESYFFNEVQRIKNTIQKISDGKKWLILIDELFKGTNVQDAMKCSIAVIEGLCKLNNALFVLSTHLYEIAEDVKKYNNIQFKYFETSVQNNQLVFSYELKQGISNDRIGYLILQREGVVQLLHSL